MAQGDSHHFGCSRHLQVQRQLNFVPKVFNVAVADMASILTQMGGDAVGSGFGRNSSRSQGIWMPPAPRVADGGNMVDINAKTQVAGHSSGRREWPKG